MKSPTILIILLLMLCANQAAWSQNKTDLATTCQQATVQEKILLHTDRNMYLTEEKVYFKAHCLTNNSLESPLSKVLYIELYNAQNQVFVQQKYALQEGLSIGSFEVPTEIPTDYYYLRAYTHYLRNFSPRDYAHQVLRIINPNTQGTKVSIDTSQIKTTVSDKKTLPHPTSELEIKLQKTIYQTREHVVVELDIPEEYLEASMSVRPVFTGEQEEDRFSLEATTAAIRQANLDFLPETNGLGITGILRDAATQLPHANVRCLLSVVGKETQLHVSETDAEGTFMFHLQNLKETQTVFIGTEQEKANTELLVFNDFSPRFAKTFYQPLAFDSLQHQQIEEIYLNKQLKKIFFPPNPAPNYTASATPSPLHNMGTPDVVVETANFITLPLMEDVFRDIVPLVNIKGRVGKRILTVSNPQLNQTYDDPLVLLDNVPVSDMEALLKLNPKKIDRVEVIHSNYILGDYLFGGVIMIKTNTSNFADFEWTNKSAFIEYKTIVEGDVFKTVTHQDAATKNNRQPDFRTTLYWNPQVKPTTKKVEFYTSDYATEYEILLRAVTKNGHYSEGRTVFLVEL